MSSIPTNIDDTQFYSSASSESEIPRAVVQIGGYKAIPKDVRINKNAHGAGDIASCVLPIAGGPDWSQLLQSAGSQSIVASIYAGFGGSGLDTTTLSRRFLGIFDEYSPSAKTNEITFQFRSLAALLIAQKVTTQISAMQTTSDFVSKAAASVGLRTNIVFAPDQQPATLQSVFATDLLYGLHNLRKWDIIVRCAMVDGQLLWIDDDVLNYINPDYADRSLRTVQYGRDLIDFKGKHAPQFNKNIKVRIRTYNPRTTISHITRVTTDENGNSSTSSSTRSARSVQNIGTQGSITNATSVNDLTGATSTQQSSSTVTGGAFTSGSTSIPSESSAEIYDFNIPNITPQQADQLALTIWQQLSEHEYSGNFSFAMTPEMLLFSDITTLFVLKNYTLSNFNSSADYPYYYARTMTEAISVQGGWTIDFECVNHMLPQAAA